MQITDARRQLLDLVQRRCAQLAAERQGLPYVPFPELTVQQRRVAMSICSGLATVEERATSLQMNRRTMDTHRRNLLKRLELKSDVQLLRYAVFKDYVRVDGAVQSSSQSSVSSPGPTVRQSATSHGRG